MLTLYNSLVRKKQAFKPYRGRQVRLYSCGPTVYDYAHIGNLRAYIVSDVLKKTLIANNFSVKHVMNITDVGHLTDDEDLGEDKIELSAKKIGTTAQSIAHCYTKAFKEDIKKLHITVPDKWVVASKHIKQQIALIKKLERLGYTYRTSDGIYFNTKKFKGYGTLLGVYSAGSRRSRIQKNNEKRHLNDFALWKFSPKGKKRLQEWKSPWGIGFPGWHIECSAMSLQYLGYPIDIHTGGIDHLTVHHPNEIAESEAAGFKPFVRFWVHNEHLILPKGKMAKSAGTGIRLQTLIDRGYDPLAFRYLCLNTHYRQKIYFSYSALDASAHALKRLIDYAQMLPKKTKRASSYAAAFYKALNDDLNTPQALAVLWDVVHSKKITGNVKAHLMREYDKVLGLGMFRKIVIPKDVLHLVKKRERARIAQDWKTADTLRAEIEKQGFLVQDKASGPFITQK